MKVFKKNSSDEQLKSLLEHFGKISKIIDNLQSEEEEQTEPEEESIPMIKGFKATEIEIDFPDGEEPVLTIIGHKEDGSKIGICRSKLPDDVLEDLARKILINKISRL
mgnify:CR=1 FL=1